MGWLTVPPLLLIEWLIEWPVVIHQGLNMPQVDLLANSWQLLILQALE
jgi:hypothetical protein